MPRAWGDLKMCLFPIFKMGTETAVEFLLKLLWAIKGPERIHVKRPDRARAWHTESILRRLCGPALLRLCPELLQAQRTQK